MFTVPRHPQFNGLADNFVKTFKSAIHAMNLATLEDAMGLPAAEVMFYKGSYFRMVNGIMIRTHWRNMLAATDLEDGSSHRPR